jgi:hypothetical protein
LEGPLRPPADGHVHVLNRLTTPAQLNGIDCGMFVIRWIECDSLGLPCDYSQLEMIHFRRLTFIELSHGRIIRRVVEGSSGFEGDYPRAFRFKNHVLTSAIVERATFLNRAIDVVKSSPAPGDALALDGMKHGSERGDDGRGHGGAGRGRAGRSGRGRGRAQACSADNQSASNVVLEPLLTSSLPSGVIDLKVDEKDASACATALSAWKDGGFKVYDTKGKIVLELGGFNTYPKTLESHDVEEQRLNTLLITSTKLPACHRCVTTCPVSRPWNCIL